MVEDRQAYAPSPSPSDDPWPYTRVYLPIYESQTTVQRVKTRFQRPPSRASVSAMKVLMMDQLEERVTLCL